MIGEIENGSGGRIRAFYYCPHTPQDNCSCRKPRTGLLETAVNDLAEQIDWDAAYMIGDQQSDVQVGRNFGLRVVLVLSRIAKEQDGSGWSVQPDYVAEDLLSAVELRVLGMGPS